MAMPSTLKSRFLFIAAVGVVIAGASSAGLAQAPAIKPGDELRPLQVTPIEIAEGKRLADTNCTTCHGDNAKGNRDVGAPNLTDKVWFYGSDKKIIMEGLQNGRGGVMPAWGGRLSETTIKALTVYVHGLGGGEK